MPILEVKNIKKHFGSTDVLKGVSFSLEKGQVLAIIGSSGSGKTTLLRCLNFLETADEGEILVNGKCLTGSHLTEEQIRANRLHFGLVFQNFNLFPQYTVLENITREEGKPEAALPKIVEGRLNGFFKDIVLLEQASVADSKKTVKQLMDEAGVTLTGFARFEVGQH